MSIDEISDIGISFLRHIDVETGELYFQRMSLVETAYFSDIFYPKVNTKNQ
jgi:hypothetical protein